MKVLFSLESAKFWVAAVAAIILAGLTAYEGVAPDGVTIPEWIDVAVAVIGAVAVWFTKNSAPSE